MAIFVDTGIFVAVRNKSDANHARAREMMEKALGGEWGRVVTSDYVFDEAVTTALARTRSHQIAVNTGRYILDSRRIEKLTVGVEAFNLAWQKFLGLGRGALSFTDCTTLALMEKHGLRRILSFDTDFDGVAERID